MPVLKHNSVERVPRKAIVLDLGDLNRQGEAILDQARAEAHRIIAEAKVETRKLIDAADDRGYAEGRERGLREGTETGRAEGMTQAREQHDEQIRTLLEHWRQALARWENDRSAMLLQAREDVLTFAFELARKIVLKLPEIDPAVVQRQVEESLALLTRPTAVEIVVHPEDRPFVEEILPDLVRSIHHGAHAAITIDESMTRGGCIVRSGAGRIDATLETQLDRLAGALLARDRSGTPPDSAA